MPLRAYLPEMHQDTPLYWIMRSISAISKLMNKQLLHG